MAGKRHDPKEESLRSAGVFNSRAEAVSDAEFAGSEFLDARDLVQVKYEMVRRVRVGGDSVSGAARTFGFSRPSWYSAAAAIDSDGLSGLLPARRGPRRAHKLSEEVLADLRAALVADPALSSRALAERVEQRFGLSVHPRSIERALGRPERPKSR